MWAMRSNRLKYSAKAAPLRGRASCASSADIFAWSAASRQAQTSRPTSGRAGLDARAIGGSGRPNNTEGGGLAAGWGGARALCGGSRLAEALE